MAERIRCSPVACAYSLRLHSAQIWYERTRLGLGRSRDDCQIGRHAEVAILPLSFPHRDQRTASRTHVCDSEGTSHFSLRQKTKQQTSVAKSLSLTKKLVFKNLKRGPHPNRNECPMTNVKCDCTGTSRICHSRVTSGENRKQICETRGTWCSDM